MLERTTTRRLEGLEPDNLLAFLALLGLLRSLGHARPAWCPRVAWSVATPPVRPLLTVVDRATDDEIVAAVAEGLNDLARHHDFDGLRDLKLSPTEAKGRLRRAAARDRYVSDLWAALVSDEVRKKNKEEEVEPTPLHLLRRGRQTDFMSRLASVPRRSSPPPRGAGRDKTEISESDCLRETLFDTWTRLDDTDSFRWDSHEDVRHALRATDPTDSKTRETKQHGANRLAAIGLSVLTVAPRSQAGAARLNVLGGTRERGDFAFQWPIWRHPISLAAIRALLGHGGLVEPATRDALGVVELRRARRIFVSGYMNITRAESSTPQGRRSVRRPPRPGVR